MSTNRPALTVDKHSPRPIRQFPPKADPVLANRFPTEWEAPDPMFGVPGVAVERVVAVARPEYLNVPPPVR
ncbi:MAG TPA: hypothetical protein VE988_19865 [Gemmataceae bacterium]|nr:hypothetical protein [Gemmataceae bacterium]